MTNDTGKLMACPKCGSNKTTWHSSVQNNSPINNGMLNLHYISPVFLRSCDECSEMLEVLSGDAVAAMLTRPDSVDDGCESILRRALIEIAGSAFDVPGYHNAKEAALWMQERAETALSNQAAPSRDDAELAELITYWEERRERISSYGEAAKLGDILEMIERTITALGGD